MPVPKPAKGEEKDHFMKRCMHEVSKNKDRSNEQNVAICLNTWREKHPSDKPKSVTGVWAANLHHKLHYLPWYILPTFFRSFQEEVTKVAGMGPAEIENMLAVFCPQRPPMDIDSNGIATISISGVLGNGLAPIEKMLGMCAYEDISSELDQALESGAKGILFSLSSPGGEATGAQETAAKIAAVTLPKASYTADLDASACYFLSCSADYKMASPSAQSGCIGTIMPVIDSSRLWETLGLEWTPIIGEAEDLKGAGMGPSLTDAQREYFQSQVNARSAAFRNFVSNYRDLDFAALRGGTYFGDQALKLNLIDAIGSYDQCYEWLLSRV